MDASAKAGGAARFSDDEEMEEAEGDVIESAPPLQLEEERVPGASGIKKKLLKLGAGWETPEYGDEVTVHVERIYNSTRDRDVTVTLKIDEAMIPKGLGNCIMSMKRGETAVFTFTADMFSADEDYDDFPRKSIIQYEIELISWFTVVEVLEDGCMGITKKILEKGNKEEGRPGVLDKVLVRYEVEISAGVVVAKTPDEGIEFCVKDGHFCPALSMAVVTMQPGEKADLLVLPQYAFNREVGRDSSGKIIAPLNSVLSIVVELVSFKPSIAKKILRDGEEGTSVADDGATVTVSYVAKLEDGTIFERKGFGESEPLVFVTDGGQVIDGLDKAVATMKKGEKVEFAISPEDGFGNVEVQRDLAKVPQCSTLIYEVEMFDFVKEKKPWEMNNQERLEAFNRKKEEGNLLYKNQKYQRAVKKYAKAAADCKEYGFFEGDEEKQAKALRISCFLNGAACSLKLKNFLESIWLCSKVLDIEFKNVKALYRRAQSFIETGDLVSAEMDIKKALEADPENREVKSLHRILKQCKAKRDAKLYANTFAPSKEPKLVDEEGEKMDVETTELQERRSEK